MRIARMSPFTGLFRYRDIPLTSEQYYRLQKGEPLSTVAPELPEDDREWLETGATPNEWGLSDSSAG